MPASTSSKTYVATGDAPPRRTSARASRARARRPTRSSRAPSAPRRDSARSGTPLRRAAGVNAPATPPPRNESGPFRVFELTRHFRTEPLRRFVLARVSSAATFSAAALASASARRLARVSRRTRRAPQLAFQSAGCSTLSAVASPTPCFFLSRSTRREPSSISGHFADPPRPHAGRAAFARPPRAPPSRFPARDQQRERRIELGRGPQPRATAFSRSATNPRPNTTPLRSASPRPRALRVKEPRPLRREQRILARLRIEPPELLHLEAQVVLALARSASSPRALPLPAWPRRTARTTPPFSRSARDDHHRSRPALRVRDRIEQALVLVLPEMSISFSPSVASMPSDAGPPFRRTRFSRARDHSLHEQLVALELHPASSSARFARSSSEKSASTEAASSPVRIRSALARRPARG